MKLTQPFDLGISLMMGQAFRWRRFSQDPSNSWRGWYSGVLGGHLIHVGQTENGVEYRVGGPEGDQPNLDIDDELRRYFMEDQSIGAIYESISRDPKVASLVREYPGLRVLRQDPWECLASFILTRSTPIEHTRRSVEAIADTWGNRLNLEGDVRHTFPSPETLIDAGADALRDLNPPFRFPPQQSQSIIEAAQLIRQGNLDWHSLAEGTHHGAVRNLRKIRGVGYKIADCVALMALDWPEAFPVDRWVRRALENWYTGFPTPSRWELPTVSERNDLTEWVREKFGPYAGYAGQYLFYGIQPDKG